MIQQVEKYGKRVWAETVLDELRRQRCLCLHCDHLGDCDVAKTMYQLCKEHDLAIATTRCRMFDSGQKIDSVIDKEGKVEDNIS